MLSSNHHAQHQIAQLEQEVLFDVVQHIHYHSLPGPHYTPRYFE
jgi:hypothetical protein